MRNSNLYSGFYAILFSALLLISLNSCLKDDFNFNRLSGSWDPELAVPLIHADLKLEDLIKEYDSTGIVHVGEDNFITLIYRDRIYSYQSDEFVTIPNQEIPKFIQPNLTEITNLQNLGSVEITRADVFPFIAADEQQLDSARIKGGHFSFYISSGFAHSGHVKITMPTVTNVGVPFSQTYPLNYTGGATPVIISGYADITGFSIDLTSTQQGYSEIPIEYEVYLENSGQAVSGTETVEITQSMNDIQFSALFGKLGQHEIEMPADSLEIEFFKNTVSGNFSLEDPRMKLTLNNSFGMPIQGSFNTFQAISESAGTINITGQDIDPIDIQSPDIYQFGESVETQISLNNTNSNITQVVNSRPNYIIYEMEALSNPYSGNTVNFVMDTSKVEVDLEVELPLYGSVFDLIFEDTVDFQFQENVDEIKEAMFRINVNNGFPVDGKVQVYFADAQMNILDSLLKSNDDLLRSGIIGPNGRVQQPHQSMTDIILNENAIENIRHVEKLIIRSQLSTSNQGSEPIRIYSDYAVDVKLGVQAKLNVSLANN